MINQISCDTSVLVNFLKIDRMDLFGKCSHSFFITDHVQHEIALYYTEQRNHLKSALSSNILHETTVTSPEEVALFAELHKNGQLGAGECAAIAVASCRGMYLAIDDKQAIRQASHWISGHLILRTQDLMLLLIQEQLLSLDEADQLITLWTTQHRFKLKISSFKDLIPK